MSTVMRFEDFAVAPRKPAPSFTQDDLALHYQRGRDEGEAAGREAGLSELIDALQKAHASVGEETAIRRQAVRDTLSALGPVVQALAAQLAAQPADRLTETLTAELERLCLAGITPVCRIAGGVDLIEKLADRIQAAGLQDVTLLPGARTEITFDSGRIAIDPLEITGQISAILADLTHQEDE